MTTQTLTLTDFLTARLDEDEAEIDAGPDFACLTSDGWMGHAATWGEQRARAEVEAKRRIVEDFMVYAADYRDAPSDFAAGRRHAALLAVTRLIEPYANHPDFNPDWRP